MKYYGGPEGLLASATAVPGLGKAPHCKAHQLFSNHQCFPPAKSQRFPAPKTTTTHEFWRAPLSVLQRLLLASSVRRQRRGRAPNTKLGATCPTNSAYALHRLPSAHGLQHDTPPTGVCVLWEPPAGVCVLWVCTSGK